MQAKGIFIFIDDDEDEHLMFKSALKKVCENEVQFALDGEEGLRLIQKNLNNIFMVISDINMPKINGLELKRIIEGTPKLKLKSIPFFFHSTADNPIVVKEAYTLGIQGFIKKSFDMSESVQHLDLLVKFWSSTVHPNSLD